MRYDRELVQTTMKAMKRVAEIKKRREHTFWKNRCAFELVFKLATSLSPAIHIKNGFEPREAACRTQQEARYESLCQVGPTNGSRTEDQAEDQSARKTANSIGGGFWSIYDHGAGLTRFPFSLTSMYLCGITDMQPC